MKIIITYLIRVFDTTWESKFLAYFFKNVDLKAITAFDKGFSSQKGFSILSFTVFAERRVKVDAVVSVKW